MPSPNKARGVKSRANLMKGGKDKRRSNKDGGEVRRISRTLLLDKEYQKTLKARLREGKIQPGVEVMVWYYAFGKPTETIETKQVTPVKLVHEYAKPEEEAQ